MADVTLLVGSKSDVPVAKPALDALQRFGLVGEAFVVSAHRAPHLPPDRPAHRLPQGDFLDRVRLWGLIPDDLLHDDDLLDLTLPPLRADLRLDEEYAPQARGPRPPVGRRRPRRTRLGRRRWGCGGGRSRRGGARGK